MSKPDVASNSSHARYANFATTHWSIVIKAGEHSSKSRQALATLCQAYWYPLYAYVRRKGYQSAEAQDLTQAFFAELLEKERLQMADQQRGRFRSFLLSSLNNFLHNQWREKTAQKRGGGQLPIQLDFQEGESRYGLEPSHDVTAEKIYERRWAMTFLENSVAKLKAEFEDSGKGDLFESLTPWLVGQPTGMTYRELGEQLNMSESAVKVAVHRMRGRCRELLLADIAETVASPDEVDDELQQLFAALEN